MSQYPFNTAYTQARERYGLELSADEFETLGMIAWDHIGNRQYKLYHYSIEPTLGELGEYYVDLPCNADLIEAVTADYEDYQTTSNVSLSGETQGGWIESYIGSRKYNSGNLSSSGKFIKHRREGNRLYLANKFNSVNIIYKGFVADDDGLPYLNSKELEAVAAFCAYANMFKLAIVTKDQLTFQMSQVLEQKWKSFCTQARVAEYITQNELDEILNVQTSWDRKRFGKSFKPIR